MLPWETSTTGFVAWTTSDHHSGRGQSVGGSGRSAPTQCMWDGSRSRG